MNQAMGECLGMASVSSGKPKMTLTTPSRSFKTTVNAEVKYNFVEDEDDEEEDELPEKKDAEDQKKTTDEKEFEDKDLDNEDDDVSDEDEKDEPVRDDWVSVIYTVNIIMKEADMKAADLRVSFKMGKLKLIGQVDTVKDDKVDEATKKIAEVQLIDKIIFNLIQKIQDAQASKQDKDKAHDEIKRLDKNIDAMIDSLA